ncbi:MAG: TnsA endonuclease N-terminal domain-containing protein [Pseudomonadales bacterium]|nr:TnsA endonuclease N-terminal domain-containing protein [Pseudomonadales bacterium]
MEYIKTRKISKKSRKKNLSNFYSQKSGMHLWCESFLERQRLLIGEFDNTWHEIETQPFTIKFNLNGRRRIYTPDIFVKRRGKVSSRGLIIEVKNSRQANTPIVHAKLMAAKGFLIKEGYDYEIFTELGLPSDEYLDNLELLYRYRTSLPQDKALIEEVVRFVGHNETITVSEVNYFIKKTGEMFSNVFVFIANGHLRVDMSLKITGKTIVLRGWVLNLVASMRFSS